MDRVDFGAQRLEPGASQPSEAPPQDVFSGDVMEELKRRTAEDHHRLDALVSRLDAFGDRPRFCAFLLAQHAFMREIEVHYRSPQLAAILPDLAARSRLAAVEADLQELGIVERLADQAESAPAGVPEALGRLYVAEGSKLGAAFLLKQAEALGLTAQAGASHLAAHPDGRARAWRRFKDALNALEFSHDDMARMTAAATAAFVRFAVLLDAAFQCFPENGASNASIG